MRPTCFFLKSYSEQISFPFIAFLIKFQFYTYAGHTVQLCATYLTLFCVCHILYHHIQASTLSCQNAVQSCDDMLGHARKNTFYLHKPFYVLCKAFNYFLPSQLNMLLYVLKAIVGLLGLRRMRKLIDKAPRLSHFIEVGHMTPKVQGNQLFTVSCCHCCLHGNYEKLAITLKKWYTSSLSYTATSVLHSLHRTGLNRSSGLSAGSVPLLFLFPEGGTRSTCDSSTMQFLTNMARYWVW